MQEIKGDVTRITSGVIVHQTNCQGAIGAGIAGNLIKKWPAVSMGYHALCKALPDKRDRLGLVQYVRVEPGLLVANSFSQFAYGNARRNGTVYTDEDLLINNVQRVLDACPQERVYVPGYIGCGLAGGDWDRVRARLAALRGNDRLTVVYFVK